MMFGQIFRSMDCDRPFVMQVGEGTFDISILKLTKGVFEVLSTSGNTYLGGEDFDERIMNWMADQFLDDTGIDLRKDRLALQRLKEAAERAKPVRTGPKVGRNEPCPCGSGKKFKQCCGKNG